MGYIIRAEDRAAFKRCRRQWDLSARIRRNLAPVTREPPFDLTRALRAALAVYYFPGMWDWDRAIVLPLVVRALEDDLRRQRTGVVERRPLTAQEDEAGRAVAADGRAILDRYFNWAPTVDRFSPLLVETDIDVIVPDSDHPDRGVGGPGVDEIRFSGRIELLVVDEHDRYWVVRHQIHRTADWPPITSLLLDEESVTFCWAWELFYPGMEVAGTIHNELGELAGQPTATPAPSTIGADHPRGGIRQHEPSGGGREVSSLRRMYVKASEPPPPKRVSQRNAPGFRRTDIHRSRYEVADAGRRLATETLDMLDDAAGRYPNPSPAHCPACAFLGPCLAMNEGLDPARLLADGYRVQPPTELEVGRLGGSSGGVGRGWVNPFGHRPPPPGPG